MKNLFAAVFFVIAPVALCAQELHGDFEQWHVSDFEVVREQPVGWKFAAPFGAGRSTDAHSGDASASIWNWYSEVAGMMALGDVAPVGGVYHGLFDVGAGVPVSGIPTKLHGVYKYRLGDNGGKSDSAIVLLLLKRYDPVIGVSDTLSFASLKLGPSETWRSFELEIPAPARDLAPDTIALGFASSDGGFCQSSECCYLLVDDLSMIDAAGAPYRMEQGRMVPVSVAPNPVRAAAVISFDGEPGRRYTVDIVDESGCRARALDAVGNRVELRRGDLASGTYLFVVHDAVGGTVARGRFVVD